jgi:hypothetical protein
MSKQNSQLQFKNTQVSRYQEGMEKIFDGLNHSNIDLEKVVYEETGGGQEFSEARLGSIRPNSPTAETKAQLHVLARTSTEQAKVVSECTEGTPEYVAHFNKLGELNRKYHELLTRESAYMDTNSVYLPRTIQFNQTEKELNP